MDTTRYHVILLCIIVNKSVLIVVIPKQQDWIHNNSQKPHIEEGKTMYLEKMTNGQTMIYKTLKNSGATEEWDIY
jgi:uncharacterized membrane protein YcaP (DUF421 family)